jgi:aromatic-L-amino-acid decarboxylase
LFDDFQVADVPLLLDYLQKFWQAQVQSRAQGPVAPPGLRHWPADKIRHEPLPVEPQPLRAILSNLDEWVLPDVVKTSHPLFLAYVTPPALDVCALGAAVTALLNQNVSFADLSPAGTALETTVIRWLGQLIGYDADAGGVLVSGGSMANLYGLALGRRKVLGEAATGAGNYADRRRQRVYCSEHVHRSVHKAAAVLGIGSDNVVNIPADENHQVRLDLLEERIRADRDDREGAYLPTAIVAAAGTRLACAFDDLGALAEIADRHRLWLHVDAAYGGFLRLATRLPAALNSLHLADSVTLDPHKLLFVPFDSGSLLVRDRQDLLSTFSTEGEYLERSRVPGADYADLGVQLGRSMKALNIWLALKYVGVRRYAEEIDRLLGLAQQLKGLVEGDPDLELLAPVAGTVICFRWKSRQEYGRAWLNEINTAIRNNLLRDGLAYINQVSLAGRVGLRVCMTNFRTEADHLERLIGLVHSYARPLL